MNAHVYRVDTETPPDDCGLFRVHVPTGMVRMSLGEIKAHIELGHDVEELEHGPEFSSTVTP